MEKQKYKEKDTRDTLKNVKPISAVTIIERVRPCLARYHHAVDRVKKER